MPADDDGLLPAIFTPAEWDELANAVGLSPQQARIVELILRGACGKQIQRAINRSESTVRTQLDRVFARLVPLPLHDFRMQLGR